MEMLESTKETPNASTSKNAKSNVKHEGADDYLTVEMEAENVDKPIKNEMKEKKET